MKAFQALYAYYRTEGADLTKIERDMFDSVRELNKLYLYLLQLPVELHRAAQEIIDQNKQKKLPTLEDLNPNLRLLENRVLNAIKVNERLSFILEKEKISWDEEHDDLRRVFKQLRETDLYRLYMAREDDSLMIDQGFVEEIFKQYLAVNEVVHTKLEEQNIYWRDDLPFAATAVIKTIQNIPDGADEKTNLLPDLYKNKLEDQKFVKELLLKTIDFSEEYEGLIADKAKNWETDRIALLDMLLMKMALCELEHFSTIPVKVTLNEYIELAKLYSTPKSKVFINGVLDKLVADFKRINRIEKRGRGLKE